MPGEPFSWNVVVSGAWNTAILTPDGIRRRLFELPEGTPIDLEVAVDLPTTLFRVAHSGVVVTPTPRLLEVGVRECTLESMIQAGRIASTAVATLPETPFVAAGVNFRYRFPEMPDALLDLIASPLDDAFSDAQFTIVRGQGTHTLAVAPGVVNVELTREREGRGTVELNFHRDSSLMQELRDWLAQIEQFHEITQRILGILHLNHALH